jgi:hypothetical protein
MSEILIVAKTKMANNKVCVGAIDLNQSISLRLLDMNGFFESKESSPYKIREFWDIEYTHFVRRPVPHSEDVKVVRRTKKGELKQEFSVLDVLKRLNFKIYTDTLRNTFEGKLICIDSASLYMLGDNVTPYSTCFWICDRELIRSNFQNKIRYNYNDGNRKGGYYMSYVGLEANPELIIPPNTLIRLSLAGWWMPQDSRIERCYLQMSGWF